MLRPKSSPIGGRAVGPSSRRPRPVANARASRAGAAQVLERGAGHVHPAVGVVDPVDRHLVDAESVVLGEHEQLGVEEPAVVLDRGQEPAGDVGAHGLEATLRITHPGGEHGAQDQVVRTGDELALRAPRHRRTRGEPRADGDVGVAGHQRRHQRGAVHRGRSRGRRPCTRPRSASDAVHAGAQGPAPSLLAQVTHADVRQLAPEPARDDPGAVGGGVVDDRDAPREREVLETGTHGGARCSVRGRAPRCGPGPRSRRPAARPAGSRGAARDRDRVGVGAEVLHGVTVADAGKTQLVRMQEPFKNPAHARAVRTGQPRRRTPFTVKRSTLRT